MYPEERRQAITNLLRSQGRVDSASLASELNVTAETVRKDLIVLERHGVVQRTHGGAILVQRLGFEPNAKTRATVMVEQKRRIALEALKLLPDEGAVFIDAGTTTALLAEFFPLDTKLTVVTNSLQVLPILSGRDNITLLSVGGRVRAGSMALIDSWAIRAVQDIRADVAYIGTNGISLDHGLTTSDPTEAALKTQMFKSARCSVVLADSTKFGAEYFHRFANVSDVDVLISDKGLDAEIVDEVRGLGPQVRTV